MSVAELLEQAALRWPHRACIVDEKGTMTFAEVAVAVAALRAALGPLPDGVGVGLVARNGRGFLIGTFALLGSGVVVMPIFHQLRRPELWAQVEDASLYAVLSEPVHDLGGEARGGWSWQETGRAGVPIAPHVPDASFIRYTSGTTGRSKGVILSHGTVMARTAAARDALDLTERDAVLWVLPMAYHFVVSIVAYVRYGVCTLICPDVHAASILDVAAAHGGTLLYASPTHYRMLAADASGRGLPALRCAVSTSSGLPADVGQAFALRFGLPLRQVYGVIECGLPLGDLRGDVESASVGYALPGFEVVVLDEEGRPLPNGRSGHLALRGPGMFDGYLNPPMRRDEILAGGWFMTGDLAWLSEDGRVTISGRSKSMINVAGHKVFPEEVEAVIDSQLGVRASRVFGMSHPIWGEVVHAEIVVDDGVDVDGLRRLCQEKLSAHKIPQRFVVVAALPMTNTGKIRRA